MHPIRGIKGARHSDERSGYPEKSKLITERKDDEYRQQKSER